MQENFDKFAKATANYVPLSPVSFLSRAEALHGSRTAVIYGDHSVARSVQRLGPDRAPL